MKVLLLLLLLIASCFGYSRFIANVDIATPSSGSGRIRAILHYNNVTGTIVLLYGQPIVKSEQMFFNANRGYTNVNNQFNHGVGECGCSSKSIRSGMPYLQPEWNGFTKTTGSNGCDTYTPKNPSTTLLTTLSAKSSGEVCGFTLTDGRVFTVTSFTTTTPPTYTRPDSCTCSQKMDIEIMMDHSGSISQSEMNGMKTFVKSFVAMLDVSPTDTNVGMSWFHRDVGNYFDVSGSATSVNNAITAWVNSFCSTCDVPQGTAISSGLRYAANRLAASPRTGVPKMLVLITDGAMNRMWGGVYDKGAANPYVGCKEWDTSCEPDLRASVAYAKALIPGVTFITVGVGAPNKESVVCVTNNCPINVNHLLIATDNIEKNLLFVSDFATLASQANNLMALVCDDTPDPCDSGCCGTCVCGTCTPPDYCVNSDPCVNNTLQGTCCVSKTANPCADQPCQVSKCTKGAPVGQHCSYSALPCPADDTCFTWSCNTTTNKCQSKLTPACTPPPPPPPPPPSPPPPTFVPVPVAPPVAPPPPPPEPECFTDEHCDDKNFCTTEKCVFTPNNDTTICDFQPTDCGTSDMCTSWKCDIEEGCVSEQIAFCDDNNNCTIDSCDPVKGCVHEDVVCPDESACAVGACDPFIGCMIVPRDCPNTDNCTFAYCDNETLNEQGEYEGNCKEESLDCFPVGLAAGLSAGIIAAIILAAALLALALLGGGTYAAVSAMGAGPGAGTITNPIYEGAGSSAGNPLFSEGV